MFEAAASPVAIEAPAANAPLRIVIPVVTLSTERCPPQATTEIVVCAADPEAFRLRPLLQSDRADPVRAEIRLGEGISAGISNEQASIGGIPSNRIKVTLKIRF